MRSHLRSLPGFSSAERTRLHQAGYRSADALWQAVAAHGVEAVNRRSYVEVPRIRRALVKAVLAEHRRREPWGWTAFLGGALTLAVLAGIGALMLRVLGGGAPESARDLPAYHVLSSTDVVGGEADGVAGRYTRAPVRRGEPLVPGVLSAAALTPAARAVVASGHIVPFDVERVEQRGVGEGTFADVFVVPVDPADAGRRTEGVVVLRLDPTDTGPVRAVAAVRAAEVEGLLLALTTGRAALLSAEGIAD